MKIPNKILKMIQDRKCRKEWVLHTTPNLNLKLNSNLYETAIELKLSFSWFKQPNFLPTTRYIQAQKPKYNKTHINKKGFSPKCGVVSGHGVVDP